MNAGGASAVLSVTLSVAEFRRGCSLLFVLPLPSSRVIVPEEQRVRSQIALLRHNNMCPILHVAWLYHTTYATRRVLEICSRNPAAPQKPALTRKIVFSYLLNVRLFSC